MSKRVQLVIWIEDNEFVTTEEQEFDYLYRMGEACTNMYPGTSYTVEEER